MDGLSVLGGHLDYVFLLFLRVSALLIGSPVFGRGNVPRPSKIGFCAVLTLVFIMAAPAPAVYPVYGHLLEYVLLCLRELFFGLAMGFVLTAMFSLALTAGSMMDYQIGFNMASIYDPQNNMQAPLTGSLLNLMLLVLFFSTDGHLRLIEIMYRTLEAVPVGTALPAPGIMWAAVEVAGKSFLLAVMIAMPLVAAGTMLEIALGAAIRTVPQLNMFVVGIPMKIIIGLFVLLLSLGVFADFSKVIFSRAFDYLGLMFDQLGSAA